MGYIITINFKQAEKDGLPVSRETYKVFTGYEDDYAQEGAIYEDVYVASLLGVSAFTDSEYRVGIVHCSYGGELGREIKDAIPSKYLEVVE